MKKVLVIGSNSFSGSDFIDLLLEKGKYQVLGVSRSKEKSVLFLPYKKRDVKYFTFAQIDLNHDLDRLKKLIEEFRPEYIVNFAAQSEVAPSWENPHHWYQTNVVGLTMLANFLKDQSFLKNYVHISSPEVYGTCVGRVKEDYPLNPTTPYAASKAGGDLSLFTFFKNFNFPLTMVRATNVYGPYQQLFKIIPRSIIYMKQGKKIPLHGGGKAVKSYIHIRDVSEGELQIMEKGVSGQIYHISPDQGVSVKTVVSTIASLVKVPLEEAVEVVEERIGQDAAYVIDSTKIQQNLGWKPKIPLEEGLKQCVSWVESNFTLILKERLEYVHKP